MVFSASQMQFDAPAAPRSVVPAITAETAPALAEMTDVEGWKRKLDPEYAATMNCALDRPSAAGGLAFKVTEDEAGAGEGAKCGDSISIQLTVWHSNGSKAFDGKLALALGSRQVASGLDAGLLGIKPKGQRTLILPTYALTRGKPSAAHDAAAKAFKENAVALVTAKRL